MKSGLKGHVMAADNNTHKETHKEDTQKDISQGVSNVGP